MTKTEFLQALETGLATASPEERVAAMQYYTEYLDDAGAGHEAEALAELGDPQKIVDEILGASAGDGDSWAPPKATGAKKQAKAAQPNPMNQQPPSWPAPPTGDDAPEPIVLPATVPTQHEQQQPGGGYGYSRRNTGIAKIVILVLLLIFLVPLAGGLIAAAAGLLVALVVLFLSPLIAGTAMVVGGIVAIVLGGILTVTSVGSGLVQIGLGIAIFMLGLMCGYAGARLLGKTLPSIIRGAVGLVGRAINAVSNLVRGGVRNG